MADLYLAGQSAKPGSSSLTLVNGTTYVLQDIDFGNAAWEMLWSGPRGTQGAKAAGAVPQNRPLVFDLRVVGTSSDDLQAKLSPLYTLFDELRRYGGTITWRPEGGTYRQHFDVLAGQARVEKYDSQLYGRHNQVILRCEAICAPYLEGDSMDILDTFSTDTIANYTFDAGAAANVAVFTNELDANANFSTENRAVHTLYGYDYGDHQVTVKAIPGGTLTSYKAGVILKRKDSDDYMEVYVDDTGAVSRLRLDIITGGSRANRFSTNILRVANTVPFWVRGRIEGNVVYLAWFSTTPTPAGGDDVGQYTLTTAEAAAFGSGMTGKAGWVWTPQSTNAKLDDFEVCPYSYVNVTHPEEIPLAGAIPGDAPAVADLVVSPIPSGVIYPWFSFAWWKQPSVWSMVWNGDLEEDANGWSNAAVANINGAATSVARVTTFAKHGLASLEVVCPATADTGAQFALWRRFKRGTPYTAEAWVRSSGTTTAYLRFGNGPGNDKASSASVALSTTWTKHTVTWTPSADRSGAHVAFNIAAATGTTFQIDAIKVYEGAAEPTATTQIEGRGGMPPLGILDAESADPGDLVETGLSSWVIGDAGAGANFRLAQALVGTLDAAGSASATWFVDPSLAAGDDYTLDEFAVEAYVRLSASSTVGAITATLSTLPELGAAYGAERFTEEFGTVGKLFTPLTTDRQVYRLGTLRFVAVRDKPTRWKLKLLLAWTGTSGTLTVDHLMLLPLRSRALSPTGRDYSTTTYPVFVPGSSETIRVIRSDLSGLASKPGSGEFPMHGLGGSLLELPPGNLTVLARHGMIPDQTNTPAATDPVSVLGAVHLRVTPRYHLARSS